MSGQFRVLIVEDNEHLARSLGWVLAGIQVDVCATIAAARAAIEQRHYGAMIFDVHLPDGSGMELLEWLRPRYGTPVLVITADETVAHANRAQLLGAEIAYKPDVTRNVRAFVGRALGGMPVVPDVIEDRGHTAGLTPREIETVRAFARLGTHAAVAEEFGVGPATTKTFVKRILKKTHHDNMPQLLAAWGVASSSAVRRRLNFDDDEEEEPGKGRKTSG